jgi:hypothetical protein
MTKINAFQVKVKFGGMTLTSYFTDTPSQKDVLEAFRLENTGNEGTSIFNGMVQAIQNGDYSVTSFEVFQNAKV